MNEDHELRQTVGARLRRMREARGLFIEELAARTAAPGERPVSRSTISRLENGLVRDPGLSDLRKLARALGTSVAYLIAEDESAAARLFDEMFSDPEFALRRTRHGRVITFADLPENVRRVLMAQVDALLDLYLAEPEPERTGPPRPDRPIVNDHPEALE